MAVTQGNKPKQGFSNTNKGLRKEIKEVLLPKIDVIDSLKRDADSIFTSNNFHLDSKDIGGGTYKVDVQYKGGTKGTVAQVMLDANATDLEDVITGINGSAKYGYIYNVT